MCGDSSTSMIVSPAATAGTRAYAASPQHTQRPSLFVNRIEGGDEIVGCAATYCVNAATSVLGKKAAANRARVIEASPGEQLPGGGACHERRKTLALMSIRPAGEWAAEANTRAAHLAPVKVRDRLARAAVVTPTRFLQHSRRVADMHADERIRIRWLSGAIVAAVIVGAAVQQASAGPAVTVRLTPRVCVEGCDARITVRIEADKDNRALIVEADSPVFWRRSVIQLDGGEAPLVHTLRLHSLPSATYEIRATLMRADEEMDAAPMRLIVGSGTFR
jgi:hypothetical protein